MPIDSRLSWTICDEAAQSPAKKLSTVDSLFELDHSQQRKSQNAMAYSVH
jgi:hypothetical protein